VLDWQTSPRDLSEVFALLSWRTRLAPHPIGQDQQLQSLIAWATNNASGPRMRFLTGEGGSGKSRIAAELAQRLRDDHGMSAGFLKLERGVDVPQRPTLFILDYPEERREFTRKLLAELAAHPEWTARLLLLSRRPLDQWDDDIDAANVRHLVDQQHFAIPTLDDADAERLFQAAVDEIVKRYAVDTPPLAKGAFQIWLARSPYVHRRPLFIMAAAIHAVIDPVNALGFSLRRVIDALVQLERGRLQRVSKDAGFREDAAPRLAAFAALRGGFGPEELERFADPALRIGLAGPAYILDDIRCIPWWSGNRWPAPQPDVLAAALFYKEFSRVPQRAPDWLWAALHDLLQPLALSPDQRLLRQNGIDRLGRLLHDIGTVYGNEQQRVVDWLIAMIRNDASRAKALEAWAYQALPASLARFGAAECNELLNTDELNDHKRAGLLNSLSNQLSETGDRAGALRAIEEAVELHARLAQARPAAFEPDLAMSLNNLSNVLSETGDRAGALRAIKAAVEIDRRLAQVQPDAFEPALAVSLSNLTVQLSESGDRAGALRAIEAAVEIRRRLAKDQPAVFEPALAMSLNNLSNVLRQSGDRAGALRAIEEAVKLNERLAQAQPAAFERNLAMSLNNLSNVLSETGDRAGALRAIKAAVEIYRRLAQVQPDAFEPALARSLNNLSNRMSESGDQAGALRAIEAAVKIDRRLAQAQPGAYESGLAGSLNNLSNRLSESDDRASALRAIKAAVKIRRRLAKDQPAAFEPDLVISLKNLSVHLSESGDRAGALRAIKAAVKIEWRLEQAQPTAPDPALVNSLRIRDALS
jgi:hypothetical protein